ncbi:MAG: DUF393 domain-containing protein [Sphingosinicella sp.]|nr:DUF393 domain-containing protein [Sphingosinicella sp.]
MGKKQPITAPDEQTSLIYDGECPVCIAYSDTVETGADQSGLQRIDARGDHPLIRRATEEGFDLDDGMVVVHGGKLYHGADALHLMATLAPKHGLHNRLNRLMFGSKTLSRLSYPLLRSGRNALLKLRGRAKIRNLDRNSA